MWTKQIVNIKVSKWQKLLSNHSCYLMIYAVNKFPSIASVLAKKSYSSSFYHGGHNGTMRFNQMTLGHGFKKYYGIDEYPDQQEQLPDAVGRRTSYEREQHHLRS